MLEPFLGKSKYANHGQRVVEGQRLMQSASDIMLGWVGPTASTAWHATSTSGSCGTARDRRWSRRMEPVGHDRLRRLCGWTLARAHARSGDAGAIAGYLGSGDRFDRAMSRRSPRRTPTRTSATTRLSRGPWTPAGSRPNSGCRPDDVAGEPPARGDDAISRRAWRRGSQQGCARAIGSGRERSSSMSNTAVENQSGIDELGPVDYLVVEFPAERSTSRGRWRPSWPPSATRAPFGCSTC